MRTTFCGTNKPNILYTRYNMCFIRSPQITPTTTFNIVYQFVLITDRECILCAVETEILNINFDKFQYTTPYDGSGGYSQASQTRGPGFDPGSIHVGFMADKVPLGKVFLWVLPFSRRYYSDNVLHSSSINNTVTSRTTGAKPGNIQQRNALSVTGEQGAETCLLTVTGLQSFQFQLSCAIII